ncbi:hypothetical protein EDC01DRAFT_636943 [Geopyxis carbonaria]|nr:hypothetical protein EDC01DRAFT_636943 [Geopyxis carbonaria]
MGTVIANPEAVITRSLLSAGVGLVLAYLFHLLLNRSSSKSSLESQPQASLKLAHRFAKPENENPADKRVEMETGTQQQPQCSHGVESPASVISLDSVDEVHELRIKELGKGYFPRMPQMTDEDFWPKGGMAVNTV